MKLNYDEFPRYLRLDRNINDKYLNPLIEDKRSVFYKKQKTRIYLFATALGFKDQLMLATEKSIDVRLFKDMSDDEVWFLFAVAIRHSGGTDILLDGKKALEITEEFANAGMKILYNKVFNEKLDFSLENELINVISKTKFLGANKEK
ncbi:MAG: hypothetical protein HQL24_04100 [Candidatus Omnitrophica bacterium]|nr:hypothetical protein [Candidatus Omnitrophota bacterium]